MHIQINGDPRDVCENLTVHGLLRDLQLNVAQVAVEINLEILDQRDFDARTLHDGDRVEIMSFIGGGASRCRQATRCDHVNDDAGVGNRRERMERT